MLPCGLSKIENNWKVILENSQRSSFVLYGGKISYELMEQWRDRSYIYRATSVGGYSNWKYSFNWSSTLACILFDTRLQWWMNCNAQIEKLNRRNSFILLLIRIFSGKSLMSVFRCILENISRDKNLLFVLIIFRKMHNIQELFIFAETS